VVLAAAAILVIAALIFGVTGGGKKASPASDFTYGLTATDRSVVISGYRGEGGAVVIPAKIDGIPVTGIRQGAFSGCTGLTAETRNAIIRRFGYRVL
jgi:hypothetical protein